jgi:hypothetical protein
MKNKIPDNLNDIIDQYRTKIRDWFLDCLDYESGADLFPEVQALYRHDDGSLPERKQRYPTVAKQLLDICKGQSSNREDKINHWMNIQLELKTYREELNNQIIILTIEEDKIFNGLKKQWGDRQPVVENPLVPFDSEDGRKYRLFLNQLRFVWEEYQRRALPIIREVKVFQNLTIGNKSIDQLLAFCRDELAQLEYLSSLFIPDFNIEISAEAVFGGNLDELKKLVRGLIKNNYILECDSKKLANMLAIPMTAPKEGRVHWCVKQSKLKALIMLLQKYDKFPERGSYKWTAKRFYYVELGKNFDYDNFRSVPVDPEGKPYKEVENLLKPIFYGN